MEMINLVLLATCLILLIVITIVLLRNGKSKSDKGIDIQQEVVAILREEIRREALATRESAVSGLNLQNTGIQNSLNMFRENVDVNLRAANEHTDILKRAVVEGLQEIRGEMKVAVQDMRQNNDIQLEKMRLTVDEKLTENLEQRFHKSFTMVSERLDAITKGFGEMQNLTSGMSDLKRVLSNVKTRGTWGESSLDNLLSQILTPEQYDKNVQISRSENADRVDFVINLPGKSTDKVWLPIDAKFPIEDYQRLIDAVDELSVADAQKALAVRLRTEAVAIKTKYIKVPKTTDFAILYLPIEGLFAEALQIRGLTEELQNKHRVILCGPTTLAALLNSLQMGFRSVAIEKRSSEIYKLLNAFKNDFQTFCSIIEKTQLKLGEVTAQINKASERTHIIQKKLDKVQIDEILPADEVLAVGEASDET
ncbi:MAG: DNA recombination protein RmuC [Clostridia bacterium]